MSEKMDSEQEVGFEHAFDMAASDVYGTRKVAYLEKTASNRVQSRLPIRMTAFPATARPSSIRFYNHSPHLSEPDLAGSSKPSASLRCGGDNVEFIWR